MWHPFKHKTIFTQRKKYCHICFRLLEWKYNSSFKIPRCNATCCDYFNNIFYGDDRVSTVSKISGMTMRLL